MKTRLFIENQEVELDESVQFAITKQFEDLSNPTKIINDWSKTVSIPFTLKNNNLFGNIYNPDRIIASGGSNNIGVYFDPYKKLDFRLQWGDSILMTGYAKMNEIKLNNGKGTYDITLFGTLGQILQEMRKITFNKGSNDVDYIIDGEEYVEETYNKDLVYNSWTSEGQTHSQLYPKYFYPSGSTTPISHPAYSVTDIIGFVPNNSFDKGFDHTIFLHTSNNTTSATKFADVLNEINFETTTGIKPEDVIPNGLLPREIGEYRSYLQLPFIYWNKLFQMFLNKAEAVTGYTFDLDSDWFNVDNPYWYKLVYMLQRNVFDEKNDEEKNNGYSSVSNTFAWGVNFYTYEIKDYNVDKIYNVLFDRSKSIELIKMLKNDNKTLQTDLIYSSGEIQTYTINLPFRLYAIGRVFSRPKFGTAIYRASYFEGNAIIMKVDIIDASNSNILYTKNILVLGKDYSVSTSGYDIVVPYNSDNASKDVDLNGNGKNYDAYYDFNVSFNLSRQFNQNILIKISQHFYNDHPVFSRYLNSYLKLNDTGNVLHIRFAKNIRSGSTFILNDLWNNDVNIFSEIIRYCKMFRIYISVDDIAKIITFKPYSKLFENYEIFDWTNKVDKNKDFVLKPITLENKYAMFNIDSNGTELSTKYKKENGIEYGAYRLVTNYEFNNNTKNLFEGCKESIVNTDNVLSWSNLYDNRRIIYSVPAEIYVYGKDKDSKFVSNFGAFFFHKGLKYFDTDPTLALRSVKLTDDTEYMRTTKNYFYEQGDGTGTNISVETYPLLDIVYINDLCVFASPKKSYTYTDLYSYKNGIYENFWHNYVNERYNIQNKLLTCYIKLLPSDFIKFKWSNFIKIGNQIYVVNKIYDYDVTSVQPTKIELITVQDIDSYVNGGYKYDYIRASANSLVVPYDHYKKITIDATNKWMVRDTEYLERLVVDPTEGNAGITTVYIGSLDETYGGTLVFDLVDDYFGVIGSTEVSVTVGGTTSFEATPFYTLLSDGETGTFTVNSTTGWHLDSNNNPGSGISINPTSWLQSGTKTVNIITTDYEYGRSLFYLEDNNGDIVSKSVYVPQPYVTFDSNVIEMSPGESTTLTIYNSANSRWTIESQTGSANVTITPNTGQAHSSALVTITAGQQTGEKVFVFGVTGSPGLNTSKLYVYVD